MDKHGKPLSLQGFIKLATLTGLDNAGHGFQLTGYKEGYKTTLPHAAAFPVSSVIIWPVKRQMRPICP